MDHCPVDFTVELPNWRETLICPLCGMNNRQRAICTALEEAIQRLGEGGENPVLYMMEQVTAMYRAVRKNLDQVTCIGSEFVDAALPSGTVTKGGIRHENAEHLSFPGGSVDLVLSCDVLEHVNVPEMALREIFRVLKPSGELFLSIPFDPASTDNTRRARLDGDRVTHLLPPVYHGDPLSAEGALVFTDFGWEVFREIQATGFSDATVWMYWNLEYGHLGGAQLFFHAVK